VPCHHPKKKRREEKKKEKNSPLTAKADSNHHAQEKGKAKGRRSKADFPKPKWSTMLSQKGPNEEPGTA
jgi:hypothetical protein